MHQTFIPLNINVIGTHLELQFNGLTAVLIALVKSMHWAHSLLLKLLVGAIILASAAIKFIKHELME